VVFDFQNGMSVQLMDDSFLGYGAAINEKDKSMALTKFNDNKWKASLKYDRAAPDRLTLDGALDGHLTHVRLELMDRKRFLLVSRGFHWIQEYPFNR